MKHNRMARVLSFRDVEPFVVDDSDDSDDSSGMNVFNDSSSDSDNSSDFEGNLKVCLVVTGM